MAVDGVIPVHEWMRRAGNAADDDPATALASLAAK